MNGGAAGGVSSTRLPIEEAPSSERSNAKSSLLSTSEDTVGISCSGEDWHVLIYSQGAKTQLVRHEEKVWLGRFLSGKEVAASSQ